MRGQLGAQQYPISKLSNFKKVVSQRIEDSYTFLVEGFLVSPFQFHHAGLGAPVSLYTYFDCSCTGLYSIMIAIIYKNIYIPLDDQKQFLELFI